MGVCRVSVVKVGGSVITRKDSPEEVNVGGLNLVTGGVSRAVSEGLRLVIVLGGGSFGHYRASRIMSEEGGVIPPVRAPEVQLSMLRLAAEFAKALSARGVTPSIHSPHTLCSSPSISSCNLSRIKLDLDAGVTPVTHGDVVIGPRGTGIISGDDLAAELTLYMGADCLIFVTDVGGVVGRDGSLLKVVRLPGDLEVARGATGFDVTGGMKRKLTASMRVAGRALVRIVGAGDLLAALRGEDVGTLVVGG